MKKSLVKIETEIALGTILAHDITRIIPGKFKGVGFKKGHIVSKEDIPELLEISNGLIKDEFDKYVDQKAKDSGCEFVKKIIVSDEPQSIAEMGHGGLCIDCDICRFPGCSFGK